MSVELDVQYAVEDGDAEPPGLEQIRAWVEAVVNKERDDAELTIRIVDAKEIRELNRDYRHKDSATNVLSFPFEAPPGVDLPLLGDVVICAAVVLEEARAQGKTPEAHWAHMVVHGVLHLLGYDHISDADAEVMERREVEILAGLGYADPYAVAAA
ncbi:MAG: rRNA maturation RNase YbeY [Gammaproteobacteria bacterium]|nr:rRNA maturation RNase YbeY [Gammaproteobacteria bacterium]